MFAVVIDRLTDEVRQESLWTLMLVDDMIYSVNEGEWSWKGRLEGAEVNKVCSLSTVYFKRECAKEVKGQVQAGWSGWRTVFVRQERQQESKEVCSETSCAVYGQEAELEVAEMKMLRFSLGVIRMDQIRNGQRRDSGPIGRRMLEKQLPGKRSTERAKEEIHGCAKRGHKVSWCRRRG